MIGNPFSTSTLDPLSLCSKVASLSLFYCYLVTVLMNWMFVYHLQWLSHISNIRHHLPSYCVELSIARINRFSAGFFPSTSCLYKSLSSSVFPASFKRQVCHHLRDQIAWDIISTYIIQFPFLNIFKQFVLFLSLPSFSFS